MNYINKMQRDCQIDENAPLFDQPKEDKTPMLQTVYVPVVLSERKPVNDKSLFFVNAADTYKLICTLRNDGNIIEWNSSSKKHLLEKPYSSWEEKDIEWLDKQKLYVFTPEELSNYILSKEREAAEISMRYVIDAYVQKEWNNNDESLLKQFLNKNYPKQ